MNIVYTIINHKLRKTHKDYSMAYGKLSYFLDCHVADKETRRTIEFNFSTQGLNKDKYISAKYVIERKVIQRKPKTV